MNAMLGVPMCDIQAQYLELQGQIEETVSRVLASGQVINGPEVLGLEEEIAQSCRESAAESNLAPSQISFGLRHSSMDDHSSPHDDHLRRRIMAVRKGKLGTVYRLGTLEKRADMAEGGELSHEFAFSSEEKVQRWFGWEILSHEKNAIDMTRARRGLPLLLIHDRSQWPGSVNEFRVDPDKKCRGITSYTPDDLGQRTAQNVESGHWNRCSIGYRVLKAKRVEVDEAGMETWLVTRWMPVECSLEPLDADPVGSGLNRSADDDEEIGRASCRERV